MNLMLVPSLYSYFTFCAKPHLVKMDGYFSAHAGKNGLAAGGIQSDQHRDALPDFGEVATGGVLVGQE